MASPDRPNQTLADFVGVAIGPVLIMGLVGSLVFFLLEVFYPAKGDYKDRLQWILFFFVFGAVLVGRISMTAGIAGRAGLYGLVLAGLTWVGMQIYVEYPKDNPAALFSPLINAFLVGVVWWSTYKLTWDCTYIDEETDINAEGLLQATGLEKPPGAPPGEPGALAPGDANDEPAPKDPKSPGFLIGWWERYQRFRESRKSRRVLGAWVVYFSLAALPLFGLGEALIPADDAGRRQYVFWLMGVYVACGLGLLLTTCFLGVRRYLRQRRLQMPAAMTGVWLTSGGVLIVVLLVLGALLPRPGAEYSIFSLASGGSDQRSASNYATQGGSSGKGEGRRIGDQPKDKGEPSSADKNGQATGRDKGEPSGQKDKDGSGGQKDKDGSGGNQKDKDGSGGNQKDKDGSGGQKDKDQGSSDKDKNDGSSRPKGNDSPDPNRDKSNSNPQQQNQKDGERDKTASQQQNQGKPDQSSSGSQPTSRPGSSWDWTSLLSTLAMVLKWIVFAVLILVVIFFLLREGLKFLANFTDWARNLLLALQKLWANLFRGREAEASGEGGEGVEADRGPPPAPFSAFVNPFHGGAGGRRPIKDLLRYTFDALQAWARERKVERRPDETPLEFAAHLGDEFPALESDVRRLALLYARSVYDYTPPAESAREFVRQFWERLEAAAEQPMSV